jgi:cell division protein FtsW (lipid II flippase)
LLSGLGIVMQLRVGAYAAGLLELVPVALGVGVFLIAAILAGKGRASVLAHTGWLAYLGALGLMGLVVAFGQRFRGGMFLPGNYNPTEMAKPLLVLFLAAHVSSRQGAFAAPTAGSLSRLACLWIVPMAMTVLLGDLGLTLLLCGVLVLMLYVSSRRIGWLAVGIVAVVALALLGGTLSAHAHVRFAMWRNPFLDPTGKGWQVLQALSAMYAGGMWGCGLGAGSPSSVPIVSSDFIYAAFGEEVGWAGCALILAVFGLFCARGWRAAANAATPFVALLGAGLTSCLAVQILLNVAGVTKALPLTGLTLPFISHGGSSLVTSFLMAGLLAAVSERK